MKVYQVFYTNGSNMIIMAPNRRHIWNKYIGVAKIYEIVIN